MTTRTDRFQVVFEVDGDGKLKAALNDIGTAGAGAAGGLDKAGMMFARVASAATMAASILGGAAIGAFALIMKNTMEAEQVSAQLDARLRSTAGAAGMTREAIDALAEATARKTTYDDDAIKSLSAMLLTFTKVHADVFPRATAAIVDMATAMGTDLQSATIQVGKALNDPIEGVSALTRVGVQFSDAQREVIKDLVETGRTAQAQGIILTELETQFGGAAAAARGTLSGALTALKNTLMDLTEGGDGSLEGATQAVNDLTDMMNDPDVKAGFDAIITGFIGVTNHAAKAVASLGNATSALREFFSENSKKSTISLENKRTDLETELFGEQRRQRRSWLGQAAAQNSPRIQEIKAEMAEIDRLLQQRRAQAIADASANGGGGKSGRFSADYEVASLNFNPNPKGKGGSGGGGGGGAPRAAAPRAMQDFGAEDLRDLQRLVEETARADAQFNKLAATLAGPLASAEYEHQQNLREIEQLGTQAGRSSEEVARLKEAETARYKEQRAEIEATLNPMQQLLDAYGLEIDAMGMGNAEKAMMNELRRQGIDLASAEAEAYLAAARATDQQARAAADALGYAEDAKGTLHDFFMDMSRDARGTLRDIDDYFASFIDSVISRWLNSGLDQLFSGGGFGGFSGGGGGGGGGFLSSLAGLFGFGGGGSSASGGASFLDAFGGFYANGGIHGPQGPIPLNAYASGGIAKRPQLALFGEGRMPEAYVPLPDGRTIPVTMSGAGGGGDTYVIHNNIRGDVTRASADQLAGKLAMKLQRQARNR